MTDRKEKIAQLLRLEEARKKDLYLFKEGKAKVLMTKEFIKAVGLNEAKLKAYYNLLLCIYYFLKIYGFPTNPNSTMITTHDKADSYIKRIDDQVRRIEKKLSGSTDTDISTEITFNNQVFKERFRHFSFLHEQIHYFLSHTKVKQHFLGYDEDAEPSKDKKTTSKTISKEKRQMLEELADKMIAKEIKEATSEYEKFTDSIAYILCQELELPTPDPKVYKFYISEDLKKNPDYATKFFEAKVEEMRKKGIIK